MTMMNTPTRTEQHRALTIATVDGMVKRGKHPEDAYRIVWKKMLTAKEKTPVLTLPAPPEKPKTEFTSRNIARNAQSRALGKAIARMKADGAKHEIIAMTLGCAMSTVERHLMQQRRAAMPKPGPERDGAIMAHHANGLRTEQIAAMCGLTRDIVRWTFNRLGVKPNFSIMTRRAMSADVQRAAARREKVAMHRANKIPQQQIADMLGVSLRLIKSDFAWQNEQARANRPEWMAGE